MTGAVWLMLLCCILGLNFLGGAFQAWVGLHLYGRWGLEFLAMCRFWKIFWLHCNGMLSWLCVVMVLWIFQVWCMNTLELVLKSKRRLLAFFLDFFVGCSNTICRCPSGVFWKFGAWWLTIWLLMMWVFPPHPLFFFLFSFLFMNLWYLVMTWLFLILGSFVIFQMSLNSWAGYEGRAKCERALELNGHQVLFEYGHGRYWYLGDQVLPQV